MTMKTTLFIAMLAGAVNAQVFLLWDSSVTNEPPRNRTAPAVDIATTNHPDFRPEFRKVAFTPAYYNVENGVYAATLDGLEDARTNAFTPVQRRGHRELRQLKADAGLPPRASDARLIRTLLDGSANAATNRLLVRALAALRLQDQARPEQDTE